MKYFDGFGNEKTNYVLNLEKKVETLEKEKAQFDAFIVHPDRVKELLEIPENKIKKVEVKQKDESRTSPTRSRKNRKATRKR